MILDIGRLENFPSNKIDGFSERLQKMFPTMVEHRCSVGKPGGFFQRLEEGTYMGHIIEHIALEIQTLAGMDVGFGRTRTYGEEGVYFVVFSYMEESVGRYAAEVSVKIAETLIKGGTYDLESDIQRMRELRENDRLGPSTNAIIQEAESRGIPWIRLNKHSLCQLGYGANQKHIQATVTSQTSSIAVEMAGDKEDTKLLLEKAEVPIPKGNSIQSEEEMTQVIKEIGFPIVIKPINGNHGRGITTNINNWEEACKALYVAQKVSPVVLIEKHISGDDYRLLVINFKLVAAAKRTAAHIIGDGKSTVLELINKVNSDPRRGYGHENVLTQIEVNSITLDRLRQKNKTINSILSEGECLQLTDTGNLSTGGTAEDVTDIVHPSNIFLAERIARIINLDICGIDIMTTDIGVPLSETGGAVLEVNAGPGFRMHLAPTVGLPRNVAGHVVDMLYPPGVKSKIPIIAVSGTNGKTTTTRLIAHIARLKGYNVGYTTTDGVYIQNRLLMTGDCTGPASAEFVLRDPTVNFAVLETARGGILREGLKFKNCDIGIITNIAADHLGLNGIHTIEQLARTKGVVAETVSPDGYSILNADDDLVYAMKEGIKSKLALFSMDESNQRIKSHAEKGGIYALYENGYITICKGSWKMRITKAVSVPLTFDGKAAFMIQNILPAALTGYLNGFSIEDIKVGLESFIPSPAQTPGRLNLFHFKDFQLLLDYAHNAAGFKALKKLIDKMDGQPKIGIVAGVGDRRVEDNNEIGRIAAQMFDEIIVRQDKHLRGKTEAEIEKTIIDGIKSIDPSKKITSISSEKEAITHAIENAKKGTLIIVCSDNVQDALNLVTHYKEEEANRLYEFSRDDIPNL
jgi:cyanophycin synthetase